MDISVKTDDSPQDWTWYHIVLTTSGAWLHGDPRTFGTKATSSAPHCRLERISWVSGRERRVQLSQHMRAVIGTALRDQLLELGAAVGAVTVSRQHVHILARIPRGKERKWASTAKLHALYAAAAHGWEQRLWGKRSKAAPVRTGAHQLQHYILRHEDHGAWVWSARKNGRHAG